MPLPTLNTPKYQVTIPSSKKVTTFRPFLVKEQKILLMALESNDSKQILSSMCEIIKNCVDDIDDPMSLALFDIEYLFAKIRSKSIGEQIEVKVKCRKCEKKNDLLVDLEAIEVVFPEQSSNKIMLTDNLGVILSYPSFSKMNVELQNMKLQDMLGFIANSIETIFDESNVYSRKDFDDQEAMKFVESMTSDQFDKIAAFFKNIPHLHKEVSHTCVFCGETFTVSFEGLQDFFT